MMIGSLFLLLFSFVNNNNYEFFLEINNQELIINNEKLAEKNDNFIKERIKKNNNKLKKYLLKTKKLKNFFLYDFESDDSIYKYVDNKISFNNLEYIPDEMLDLKGEFLIDTKGNQKIRKIALYNLLLLSKDFYINFGEKLKIVSSYRSYKYQKRIKDGGCSDIFCAKAGYSEHQTGLAVDLWEATEKKRFKKDNKLKKYFEWMSDNGYKYGFINTYQKGIDIDGYVEEPWHWRYIGIKLASYLKKEKITFSELYYKNKK